MKKKRYLTIPDFVKLVNLSMQAGYSTDYYKSPSEKANSPNTADKNIS